MVGAKPQVVDGITYWRVGPEPKLARRPGRNVHLLPVYDEYLVAYRDLTAVPRPAYLLGGFLHSLVITGQVVGTWRTILGKDGVTVSVSPHRKLAAAERLGVAKAMARFGSFQQGTTEARKVAVATFRTDLIQ
jgi:hypothetical protein